MDNAKIDNLINQYEGEAGSLIQLLLEIQDQNHWLSKETLEKISRKLKVPMTTVQHVATFYKSLSVTPEARHEIHVCNGTTCHMLGANHLINTVQELAGVKAGETDPTLKYAVETVTCMGRCSSGPAIIIDGNHYGSLDSNKTADLMKRIK